MWKIVFLNCWTSCFNVLLCVCCLTAEALEVIEDSDMKRGITFQIAKNKGLTPHRKKEQRNPRVKNRNKYRKAKIRRKGQVRNDLVCFTF